MGSVKSSIKLLRINLLSVMAFELLVHIIAVSVLVPLYYVFCNLAIKLAGINYLNRTNVGKFFVSPGTYLFIIVYLILLAFFIMVNISGVVHNNLAAAKSHRVGPFRLFLYGIKGAVKCFRPKNLYVGFIALIFTPVITVILYTLELLQLSFPGYVVSYFEKHVTSIKVITVIYLMLLIFAFNFVYAMHYFFISKGSFYIAMRRQKKLLRGRKLRTLVRAFIWVSCSIGIFVIVGSLILGMIIPKLMKIVDIKALNFIINSVIQSVKMVLIVLAALLGAPLSMCFLTNEFVEMLPEKTRLPNIADYKDYNPKKSFMKEKAGIIALLAIAFVLDMSFYALKKLEAFSINADYLNSVTITAHRGASLEAPENTLAAFELAINEGADIIELDVRETKDHVIIVQHDETFERTIGDKRKVGDLTYDEICQLSAGKWFGEEFKDEKVPTLEEAIDLIKGRADLNIELKPASTDERLESEVVRIVNEKEIKKNCVVTSLNYNEIKKIKLLDPEIKTIYVMSVALGNYYDLKYADGFSVKYTFVTSTSVKKAHKQGKEVYVWTVNSKRLLEKLMLLNVDSIITDNPYKMRRNMMEIYEENSLMSVLNSYFKSFF